jgi:hypothetical protein
MSHKKIEKKIAPQVGAFLFYVPALQNQKRGQKKCGSATSKLKLLRKIFFISAQIVRF